MPATKRRRDQGSSSNDHVVGNGRISNVNDQKTALAGPVVFWFRKDLRTTDNRGLHRAWELAVQGRKQQKTAAGTRPLAGNLLTIYVVCGSQWHAHDLAACKVDLMLRSVRSVQSTLESPNCNIPVTVLHADSMQSVPDVVAAYCRRVGASALVVNAEYEVDERRRDEHVERDLNAVRFVVEHDECVIPPGLVTTKDGSRCPVVYSPFRRAWEARVTAENDQWTRLVPAPEPNPPAIRSLAPELFGSKVPDPTAVDQPLPGFERAFDPAVLAHTRAAYPTGEIAAMQRVRTFASHAIKSYSVDRDFPALENGTASVSAYLNVGAVSIRQCLAAARDANHDKIGAGDPGCVHWIQELVWRDFYRHIMVAFPRVSMNLPFKPETTRIAWTEGEQAQRYFTAWKTGRTGYPLVDAGMRQLVATGFLSNRVRMVVAMFLTKDLLINWQWGERFFMHHQVDGDLASNNGGWQWAASTGTDSQPYFRVFNPMLQASRFDPDGTYIRQWVPELRNVTSNAAVHEPFAKLSTAQFMRTGYPQPIVDHKVARERAIAAFKAASAL
ncbi:FAD binding domain of DNA photolyase-domain-containing protein [Blastocladiella britannica]|nr:FAD binding domain of DNA photolyase-domain-containing protein [Blastocladiella britannica]